MTYISSKTLLRVPRLKSDVCFSCGGMGETLYQASPDDPVQTLWCSSCQGSGFEKTQLSAVKKMPSIGDVITKILEKTPHAFKAVIEKKVGSK